MENRDNSWRFFLISVLTRISCLRLNFVLWYPGDYHTWVPGYLLLQLSINMWSMINQPINTMHFNVHRNETLTCVWKVQNFSIKTTILSIRLCSEKKTIVQFIAVYFCMLPCADPDVGTGSPLWKSRNKIILQCVCHGWAVRPHPQEI